MAAATAVWLGACSGATTSAGEQTPSVSTNDPCDASVWQTWHTFGQGYVSTWCTPCHSETLVGDARRGAPDAVNLDRWEDLQTHLQRSIARSVAPDPTMPPGGGIQASEIALWTQYLECGAPGTPTPSDSCDTLSVAPGDVVLGDAAAVSAFCAEFNAVAGSAQLTAPGEVTCLCEVGGDVVVTGDGALSAPALLTIGGGLELVAGEALTEVTLEVLAEVGGAITAVGLSTLERVALPSVHTVSGDVVVTDDPVLASLGLERLTEVQGSVRVSRNALLDTPGHPDLVTVGGDLIFGDNGAMDRLTDTQAVEVVGGDVRLRSLGALTEIGGFDALITVGGDVDVTDNPVLTLLADFSGVEVAGSVRIERNPLLREVAGFQLSPSIGGELRIAANEVLDEVSGFANVTDVGGTIALVGNLQLTSVRGVAAVEHAGGLELVDNPLLVATPVMERLESLDGSLSLVRNPEVVTLGPFPSLSTIGGDFEFVDNRALATPDIWALHDHVGAANIGGVVTLQGNGP